MQKKHLNIGCKKLSIKEKRLAYNKKTDALNSQNTARFEMTGPRTGTPEYMPSEKIQALQGQSGEIANASINSPFGGRADAPPIDEDYAKMLAHESVQRFMQRNTLRKDPEMQRLLNKAFALMEVYGPMDGKVETALVFGWEGRLVVKNLDPERQKWALAELEDQISYLTGDKQVAVDLKRTRTETEEAFKARLEAARRFAAASLDYDRAYRDQQVADWRVIQKALQEYNSDYNFYRSVSEAANPEDPDAAVTLTDVEGKFGKQTILAWGKKYPVLYRKLLERTAKLNPTDLAGRENEFVGTEDLKVNRATGEPSQMPTNMDTYFGMLLRVMEVQPAAVVYYPERLKRFSYVKINDQLTAGADHYRKLVVEAAAEAPIVLIKAAKEFNRHWRRHPDQFEQVLSNAVNAQPSILLEVPDSAFAAFLRNEDIADKYRELVVANVQKEPRYFSHVLKQFNFWKKHPEDLKKVLTTGIEDNPERFWQLSPTLFSLESLRQLFLGLNEETQGKIVGSVRSLSQLVHINGVVAYKHPTAGVAAGLRAYLQQPTFTEEQLLHIGSNASLMNFLQFVQPSTFKRITEKIQQSSNADLQSLATKEHIVGEPLRLGSLLSSAISTFPTTVKSMVEFENNFLIFNVALNYMPDRLFAVHLPDFDIPVELLTEGSDLYKKIEAKVGKERLDAVIELKKAEDASRGPDTNEPVAPPPKDEDPGRNVA